MRLAICLLAIVLLLSGCWSRKELNDIAIAEGVGIDLAGDQFELTVQIVNPSNVSKAKGERETPVIVYSSKGVTLNEAVRRMTSNISRKIYFAHIRILVFSEDLAQKGIVKAMDYLQRGNEFRSDFNVVIARGTSAKDVLSVMTPLEKVPANYIFNSLEVAKKEWTPTVAIKLDELSDALVTPGRSPVVSGIQIAGYPTEGAKESNISFTTPPVRLQYSGNAIFKKDKLIGWMNEKESRAYSIISGKSRRSSVHVLCPNGGNIGVDIARVTTKMHAKIKNNKPEIFIESRFEGNVSDVECKIDLDKLDTITQLNKEIINLESSLMEHIIKKAQNLDTDIFGFGEAVHRADKKYWKRVKDDWGNYFKKVQTHIDVNVQIRGTGTMGESVVGDVKE
ncbi:Ger(x)C family spore germination protein [Paenibacillus sp. SYP-B3998]|uniref:Ger(X)C family spore germination protein n=1 Tax=Paenibacillus sp. SYP-B3998 TaxID=2678564 RepID=A0A6G3ZY67_9BACL|nr:Ger(x)C family spore germination protein [Paenibacillus sp. SYP-B3998]NEW06634.1 Ger(x)C family spore germination protein [Paenibacillus sp. SYP-B3998]